MDNDSVKKTLLVAIGLCLICSLVVSVTAVKLKPLQDENMSLDIKRNMLLAAGVLTNPDAKKDEVLDSYKKITPALVDLESGKILDGQDPDYDFEKMAKDPHEGLDIDGSKDKAGIKRRAKKSPVYILKDNGVFQQLILPVYGKGLWSTMFGFLALDKDLVTVKGFAFYKHGETPGLGGEVDNPKWKSQWPGKKLFDDNGSVDINVIKGKVDSNSPKAIHQIDGLAGATITSRGVENLLRYWLDENGFGPFLKNFKNTQETL